MKNGKNICEPSEWLANPISTTTAKPRWFFAGFTFELIVVKVDLQQPGIPNEIERFVAGEFDCKQRGKTEVKPSKTQ